MIGRIETRLKKIRRLFSRTEWTLRLFQLPSVGPTPNDDLAEEGDPTRWKNGLILIQIDGLGRHELQKALDHGEMPFLSRLIEREHYRVNPFYSGLPSSTPAVQGELFYGVKTAVPAFAYLDNVHGDPYRMYEPDSAAAIENKLKEIGKPLLAGGSAYCNIYSGGASESHFCAASIGWNDIVKDVRPLAWIGVAVLHFPMLLRAFFLGVVEVGLAIFDVVRGWQGFSNLKVELKFIVARVGISILLRDMITIGASADISRNLPIVHLNYIGYDEQAHRRGPSSAFAHWSLKGIDKCIQRLWKSSHRSQHRHYDVWIYSDHGQESTVPYEELSGNSIKDAVERVLGLEDSEYAEQLLSLNECIVERRATLLGGRRFQKLIPVAMRESIEDRNESHQAKIDQRPSVVAMGPVGHVYLSKLANDFNALARMAQALVDTQSVPGVFYVGFDGGIVGYVAGRCIQLPVDVEILLGTTHPAIEIVGDDLEQLIKHPDAGNLVLLGWVEGTDAVSFPFENGAHAGIGPRETDAFALLPADIEFKTLGGKPMRPTDLRKRVFEFLDCGALTVPMISARKRRRNVGQLRIMTYNVHSCIGMDGKVSPERIARVIARYQPDVVALQELDFGKIRTQGIDQAKLIADMLGMEYHFHPSVTDQDEEYGDAILSHLPFSLCRASVLPTPPSTRKNAEPRGVLWVTLDVDGIAVQVLNTHLGLYAEERRIQVRELVSKRWLSHKDCHGPTVFCGDFNAMPRSYTLRKLKTYLTNAQSLIPGKILNTFASRVPTLCLDHILVREIDSVFRVIAPTTELTRLASDHLPLIVDLSIPVSD